MDDHKDVLVLSPTRTAIGKYGGGLAAVPPCDLAAAVVREAVGRAGVDPADVGHVVFGNVIHTEVRDMYLGRVARRTSAGDAAHTRRPPTLLDKSYSLLDILSIHPIEEEIQMPDVRTATQEFQEQVLDTIRKSQEAVTDAIRTWAETVQSITPSLPAPSVPFADKLPKPGELVSSAYDFAEQLLATQRKFAEDVIAATAPVLTAKNDKSDTAAKKSAPQAK